MKKITFLLIFLLILISCGTLNRKKSKFRSMASSKVLERESNEQKTHRNFSKWQEFQLQNSNYSTAFIHSDSTISYRPESGFQLNSGTVVLTKASREQFRTEEHHQEKEETEQAAEQESSLQEKEMENIFHNEKERHSITPILFIGLTAVGFFLFFRFIRKAGFCQ